jgi:hypothetical protein
VPDHLQRLQREIAATIDAIPAEGLTSHPVGKWSAGEVLEHLYSDLYGDDQRIGTNAAIGQSARQARDFKTTRAKVCGAGVPSHAFGPRGSVIFASARFAGRSGENGNRGEDCGDAEQDHVLHRKVRIRTTITGPPSPWPAHGDAVGKVSFCARNASSETDSAAHGRSSGATERSAGEPLQRFGFLNNFNLYGSRTDDGTPALRASSCRSSSFCLASSSAFCLASIFCL